MSENQDMNLENINHVTSENYEKIKSIGAQKIHEQTHIPKVSCEDLVNGYFKAMNRIQFLGFVSILEREYSLDLSDLRAEGMAHFSQIEEVPTIESKVFITPKKTNSYALYYIVAALVIFIMVAINMPSSDRVEQHKIDNAQIEEVASKLTPQEEALAENQLEQSEPKVTDELKIIPQTKLWVGYINLNTGRKYQKIVEELEELELDPSGHWLITLGHGHVTFSINNELNNYKDYRNIRFLYKDGELKKITHQEFLDLNKGQEW
ncbi:MAG: hypothetical protein OQK11_01325 [Thiovulaceae bacterium]|nr:hypothetical protein [Sulfurimonadaceae bacterium]